MHNGEPQKTRPAALLLLIPGLVAGILASLDTVDRAVIVAPFLVTLAVAVLINAVSGYFNRMPWWAAALMGGIFTLTGLCLGYGLGSGVDFFRGD